jgi:hypothetical protein
MSQDEQSDSDREMRGRDVDFDSGDEVDTYEVDEPTVGLDNENYDNPSEGLGMGDMGMGMGVEAQRREAEDQFWTQLEQAKNLDFEEEWVNQNAVLLPGKLHTRRKIDIIPDRFYVRGESNQELPDDLNEPWVEYFYTYGGLVSERSFITDSEEFVSLVVHDEDLEPSAYNIPASSVMSIEYDNFSEMEAKKSESKVAYIKEAYRGMFGEEMPQNRPE